MDALRKVRVIAATHVCFCALADAILVLVRRFGALLVVVCLLMGQAHAGVSGTHVFWHDHEQPHSHDRVLDHHLSDADAGGLHQHVIAGHVGKLEACRSSIPIAQPVVAPAGPLLVDLRRVGGPPLQAPIFQESQRPNAPPGEVPARAPPLRHD